MNPYEILELPNNSSIDEVERAYKKLAFKFHPDRNIGDDAAATKFQQIQEAYDRIKKPENFRSQQQFRGCKFSYEDIVFPFFQADPNIQTICNINLKEAYYGTEKTISFAKKTICNHCSGKKYSKTKSCPKCVGSGSCNNFEKCQSCNSCGQIGIDKCNNCNFTGFIKLNSEVVIKIPPGVRENSVMRLRAAGNNIGIFTGDLLVQIKLQPYQNFYVKNDELCIDLHLPLTKFIEGGDIDIKCINDEIITVKILSATPDGTKLRVKGKGLPHMNSSNYDDLTAILKVQIPQIFDPNVLSYLKSLGI